MASTYLQRSTTTRTNNQAYTFSFWFKRSGLGSGRFCINYLDGNNRGYISIQADGTLFLYDKAGGVLIETRTSNFNLNDTNGWYHYVQSVNTLAGGSGGSVNDRFKSYLNGVDVSDQFTGSTNTGYNVNLGFQAVSGTNGFKIGSQETGSDNFDGLMSHVHFVDGLQLPASTFGETDTTTGEWKIKTSPTVSEYGNNGFFILKDGNSLTDQSGKGNNFSLGGGTLTKTEDNPSNVFATYNPLCVQVGTANEPKFGNGNTSILGSSSGAIHFHAPSTIGVSSGKWYAEFKGGSASNQNGFVGVTYNPGEDARNDDYPGQQSHSYAYFENGNKYTGDSGTSYGDAWTTDIIGVALDLDNHKLYFSKNGTWQNSGDPTSGSTGTGLAFSLTTGQTYFFATGDGNASYINPFDANFGNGYFGTTAVASAGTNASGIGIFEYAVPTGYTALSTKGLNL